MFQDDHKISYDEIVIQFFFSELISVDFRYINVFGTDEFW